MDRKEVAAAAAAAAKSLQSCLTLWDPIDSSPPGSPIPGILQARTLEWVAISFSNAEKWKEKMKSLSRFWFFTIPQTAAYQAAASMGFSRQEYWSGVPLPSPSSNLTRISISICRDLSSIDPILMFSILFPTYTEAPISTPMPPSSTFVFTWQKKTIFD